jgi:hypothetical protein
VIFQAQIGLAVAVILTLLLALVSPTADLPSIALRAQQTALVVVLAVTFAIQQVLLRRSSDPVLQGVFDATSSRVSLSGSSTLVCALVC